MILRLGTFPTTYSFDNNEVSFSWVQKQMYGKTNRKTHHAIRMDVTGVKQGSNAADLTTKLQALEAALEIDDVSVNFYDNDGNPTVHTIDKDQTLNGVRFTNFEYSKGLPGVWGSRTEYVNVRTYKFTIEAEIPNVESDLFFWSQSIAILSTSGIDFVVQDGINASIYQQTAAFTKQVVEQFGYAIGFLNYPTLPSPIWSTAFLKPQPYLATSMTPMNFGLHYHTLYPVRWRYHFEAPSNTLTVTNPGLPTF